MKSLVLFLAVFVDLSGLAIALHRILSTERAPDPRRRVADARHESRPQLSTTG